MKKPRSNKKIIRILALLVFVGIAGFGGYRIYMTKKAPRKIDLAQAKTVAEDFIKANMGPTLSVKEIMEEKDGFKITVDLGQGGQPITSYLSKDGKRFFPYLVDIAQFNQEKEAAVAGQQTEQTEQTPAETPKSDKPVVELFVMSYCPYGTQIEKGIIPAIQALGSKIDFSLKFVSYAMHGDKEIAENLREYCIQKNEPAKLISYLSCFLKVGEGTEASCAKTAGVTQSLVDKCVSATDKQLSITADAADKTKWSNSSYPPFNVDKADNEKYSVGGSPTLVINGATSNAARDPASLLVAICGAFNTSPVECQTQLPSTAPSAGFGEVAGSATTDSASCGN